MTDEASLREQMLRLDTREHVKLLGVEINEGGHSWRCLRLFRRATRWTSSEIILILPGSSTLLLTDGYRTQRNTDTKTDRCD